VRKLSNNTSESVSLIPDVSGSGSNWVQGFPKMVIIWALSEREVFLAAKKV